MAWIIKSNGERIEAHPASGKKFKLEELQAAVGGYIELVRVHFDGKVRNAYVNEEGLLNQLPLNPTATAMLAPPYNGNVIVGDMIVMLPGEGG